MEHSCRRLVGEVSDLRRTKRKYSFQPGSERGKCIIYIGCNNSSEPK